MKVIVVGGIKGGTGKTTIATNLTVGLMKLKKKVLLVDSDPNGSAMAWRLLRKKDDDDIATVSITTPTLHKDIPKIGQSFDYIVVDVGGRDSEVLRSAFLAADLIIIPVLASPYDIWSAEDTVRIANEANATREGDKAAVRLALNQIIINSVIFREAVEALEDESLPDCMDVFINMQTIYKNATKKGLSVLEMRKSKKTERTIVEMEDFTGNALYILYEMEKEKEKEKNHDAEKS